MTPSRRLAIVGATIVDGRGGPPLAPGAILIDGERIAAVGPAAAVPIPPGAERLALDGMYVLPGLIDAHVHFQGRRTLSYREHVLHGEGLRAARGTADLARLLEAGFTTVRDCGSYTALALKQALAEGSIPGPRLLAAGRFVERTGGADDPAFLPLEWVEGPAGPRGPRLADGPAEVRRAVREQLRDGADLVKTCQTGAAAIHARSRVDVSEWTMDELRALVDEGHRLGVRVAVRAHGPRGIREAVEAGADTIEHGTWLDDEGARMMADRGVVLVPTFFALQQVASLGAQHGAPDFVVRKTQELEAGHPAAFQRALRHGVPIAMGTDCTGTVLTPHGRNAVEVELMVRAGMDPMAAIVATTSGAARALGVEGETGALAAGLAADLIAVAGDPVASVAALQDVRFVMQRGTVVVSRIPTSPSR
jgi:imidazolonepropionase-like amidohydrolase